jgi:hypothetical protein
VDCCGGARLFGLAVGEAERFAAAEARILQACPPLCECVGTTSLPDGTVVEQATRVSPECVGGRCEVGVR